MKIKKVNEESRKSVKEKKTSMKKQKKHLSKVTTTEFFEQNFDDTDSDEIIEKQNNTSIHNDKNTGIIFTCIYMYVCVLITQYFKFCTFFSMSLLFFI